MQPTWCWRSSTVRKDWPHYGFERSSIRVDSSCSISRQTVGGSGIVAEDAPVRALLRLSYDVRRATEASATEATLRRLAPGHAIRSVVDVPTSGGLLNMRFDIVPERWDRLYNPRERTARAGGGPTGRRSLLRRAASLTSSS
jgi:hypothetical protein